MNSRLSYHIATVHCIFDKTFLYLFTGHFTQVVWKNTQKLGIAKAKSPKSGKIIVVANYEPAGNWIGQYKDNVPPPKQGN